MVFAGNAPSTAFDLIPVINKIETFPKNEDNIDGVAGMYVLERVPSGPLKVAPFANMTTGRGATKSLQSPRFVLGSIISWASFFWRDANQKDDDSYVGQWKKFQQECFPKTDNAEEYIATPGNR